MLRGLESKPPTYRLDGRTQTGMGRARETAHTLSCKANLWRWLGTLPYCNPETQFVTLVLTASLFRQPAVYFSFFCCHPVVWLPGNGRRAQGGGWKE